MTLLRAILALSFLVQTPVWAGSSGPVINTTIPSLPVTGPSLPSLPLNPGYDGEIQGAKSVEDAYKQHSDNEAEKAEASAKKNEDAAAKLKQEAEALKKQAAGSKDPGEAQKLNQQAQDKLSEAGALEGYAKKDRERSEDFQVDSAVFGAEAHRNAQAAQMLRASDGGGGGGSSGLGGLSSPKLSSPSNSGSGGSGNSSAGSGGGGGGGESGGSSADGMMAAAMAAQAAQSAQQSSSSDSSSPQQPQAQAPTQAPVASPVEQTAAKTDSTPNALLEEIADLRQEMAAAEARAAAASDLPSVRTPETKLDPVTPTPQSNPTVVAYGATTPLPTPESKPSTLSDRLEAVTPPASPVANAMRGVTSTGPAYGPAPAGGSTTSSSSSSSSDNSGVASVSKKKKNRGILETASPSEGGENPASGDLSEADMMALFSGAGLAGAEGAAPASVGEHFGITGTTAGKTSRGVRKSRPERLVDPNAPLLPGPLSVAMGQNAAVRGSTRAMVSPKAKGVTARVAAAR